VEEATNGGSKITIAIERAHRGFHTLSLFLLRDFARNVADKAIPSSFSHHGNLNYTAKARLDISIETQDREFERIN